MHAATQQGENTNGSNEEVDRAREEESEQEIHTFAYYSQPSEHGTRTVGTQISIRCAQDFHTHQVACDRQEAREQSE